MCKFYHSTTQKLHFNTTRYADLPLHYVKAPPWHWLTKASKRVLSSNLNFFCRVIAKELAESNKHVGRTVFGKAKLLKYDHQLNSFKF